MNPCLAGRRASLVGCAFVLAACPARAPLAADWLYHLGGADPSGGPTSSVYFAEVLPGGALGPVWTVGPPLPVAATEMAAVVVGNDVVVVMGSNDCSACAGMCLNHAYFGTVNTATGALSGWASTSALPQASYGPRAVADAAGWVYVVGMGAGMCWSGQHVPGAGIASWSTQTLPPTPGGEHNAVGDGVAIFVAGGLTNGTAAFSAGIGGGTIGSWGSVTALPAAIVAAPMAAAGGYAFLFGGWAGGMATTSVYSAPIAGTTLGPWSLAATLPVSMHEHTAAYAGGHFYLAGGFSGTNYCAAPMPGVWSAPDLGGGSAGGFTARTALPSGRGEGAMVAVLAAPTQPPTASATSSPSPVPSTTALPAPPAATCAPELAGATPPYLLVDRNSFRPREASLRILWAVAGRGTAQITVFDSAGELVRRLALRECGAGAAYESVWDGRNDEGRLVSSNVYVLRLAVAGDRGGIVHRVGVLR